MKKTICVGILVLLVSLFGFGCTSTQELIEPKFKTTEEILLVIDNLNIQLLEGTYTTVKESDIVTVKYCKTAYLKDTARGCNMTKIVGDKKYVYNIFKTRKEYYLEEAEIVPEQNFRGFLAGYLLRHLSVKQFYSVKEDTFLGRECMVYSSSDGNGASYIYTIDNEFGICLQFKTTFPNAPGVFEIKEIAFDGVTLENIFDLSSYDRRSN